MNALLPREPIGMSEGIGPPLVNDAPRGSDVTGGRGGSSNLGGGTQGHIGP